MAIPSKKSPLIIVLLFSLHDLVKLAPTVGETSNSNADDPALEMAERWICYSIHLGERSSYRNPYQGLIDDSSAPPISNTLQSGSQVKKFVNGNFDIPANKGCMISCLWPSMSAGSVMKAVGQSRKLIREDLDHWEGQREVPNWVKTLRGISDAIGWQHFAAFSKMLGKRQMDNVFEVRGNFFEQARIEPTLLADNLTDLSNVSRRRLTEAVILGDALSGPMLHIVLYQVLLRMLYYNGYRSPRRNDTVTSVPRRNHVIHWLKLMIRNLMDQFDHSLSEFTLGVLPMLKDEEKVRTVLLEWDKYARYWRRLVENGGNDGMFQEVIYPNFGLIGRADQDGHNANYQLDYEESEDGEDK